MKQIKYVQIMGHEYAVETDAGEEEYMIRLAQFVQDKMKELKEDSKIIDSYKLAVLTAMNIADELFRLQDAKGTTSKAMEEKAGELCQLLDSVLWEPAKV